MRKADLLRKYRSNAGSESFEGGERSENKMMWLKRATIISGKWAAFEGDYLSGGKKIEERRASHAGRETTYAWWITRAEGKGRKGREREDRGRKVG